MRNLIQKGDTITIPAPANVVGGEVAAVGSFIGVVASGALSGADMDLALTGVYELPKVSALAISIGDVIYYDSGTKLVNKTSSGNTKIGVAVTAAANPSGSVNVRLNGAF